MSAPFTVNIPKFKIRFNLGTANTIKLTDLIQNYSGYGMVVKAIFQIEGPDGLLFYQNAGFSSSPPSFSTPDFNSATSTWETADILLRLDDQGVSAQRGTYTVTAWYQADSNTPVMIVKSYYLNYVSPVPDIHMVASCRTSELTIVDGTDYLSVGESPALSATLSRICQAMPPSGSGAAQPATTTTTTITYSRVIGGGDTSATRLWTGSWQTAISTSLTYEMATWGQYAWVIIQDVVNGYEHINVQCSDCVCALNTCWQNLIIRWKEAEANHTVNVNDLRYKVALGSALWTDFYNMERCGEDTTYKCQEIKELLNSVCECTGDEDGQSKVIVPWGPPAGSSEQDGFAFRFSATDPAEESGNDGDVTFQTTTKNLWYKTGGSWLDKGTLSGSDGASGADAVPETTLFNDTINQGTSAGQTLEKLGEAELTAPIDFTTGDEIYCKAVFEFAENDNGKEASLYINATKIASHFTDTAINATNKSVVIEMWINVTGVNTQSIETLITRGGNSYPGYTTATFNTSSQVTINAYGQNSVAVMGDIILRVLKVKYSKQISTQ